MLSQTHIPLFEKAGHYHLVVNFIFEVTRITIFTRTIKSISSCFYFLHVKTGNLLITGLQAAYKHSQYINIFLENPSTFLKLTKIHFLLLFLRSNNLIFCKVTYHRVNRQRSLMTQRTYF